MFVRDEARIPVAFAVVCTRLAGLAAGGLLLDAAQAAYGDGATGLARVGPPGTWPGLSKLVTATIRDFIGRLAADIERQNQPRM
jgi:hypothetical protein